MGMVVATIKVMPESVEVDLTKLEDAIRGAIPEGMKLNKIERKPIAFGLNSVMVQVVMGDSSGGTGPVEDAIKALPGVSDAEAIDVRRPI